MAAACDDSGPSVYTARAYQAADACLDAYTPIGLVDVGALSALCAPTCLMIADSLYVSTLCPPYPAEATAVSASAAPSCGDALALLKADTTCKEK